MDINICHKYDKDFISKERKKRKKMTAVIMKKTNAKFVKYIRKQIPIQVLIAPGSWMIRFYNYIVGTLTKIKYG